MICLPIMLAMLPRIKKPMEEIEKYVSDNFSFRPGDMIKELDLLKPIYKQTACYGHFGRNEFSWEKIR